MQRLGLIVVPLDFSQRSAGAVRYAKLLACHFAAELRLVHVLSPPPREFEGGTLGELYRNRAAAVEQQINGFVGDELAELPTKYVILEGDPAQEIVGYAHAERADLLVMATHGYGPFRQFILGSNTAKVLHDADCPVWSGVHLEDAPVVTPAPFRRILCAVDLGPQTQKTLEWAAAFRKEYGAQLTLVHATMPMPDQGEAALNWEAKVRVAATEALEELEGESHTEAGLLIESGEPASVICSAAARLEADLLVIGRGSAAGVFGRLRTNAYAIVRQSPCPVVSV